MKISKLENKLPKTEHLKLLAKALQSSQTPEGLNFFYGDKNSEFKDILEAIGLDNESEKIAEYLLSDECILLMKRKKMLIYFEARNIFYWK